MIELIYVSRAENRFTNDEVEQLLAVARRNNTKLNVTGLLLYDGVGTFIQVLEGDDEIVSGLFEKIKKDDRHSRINTLWSKNIDSRRFPDWKMGFHRLNDNNTKEIQGYSDFFQNEKGSDYFLKNQGFVVDMLNHFKL